MVEEWETLACVGARLISSSLRIIPEWCCLQKYILAILWECELQSNWAPHNNETETLLGSPPWAQPVMSNSRMDLLNMALFNESKEPTGESDSTEHKIHWLHQSDNYTKSCSKHQKSIIQKPRSLFRMLVKENMNKEKVILLLYQSLSQRLNTESRFAYRCNFFFYSSGGKISVQRQDILSPQTRLKAISFTPCSK